MKSISQIQKEIHELAKAKGWYDGTPRSKLELLVLVHAELSEAVEEIRKDRPPLYYVSVLTNKILELGQVNQGSEDFHELKPEGEVIELADAVIRIMDYCEFHGMDLEQAIKLKHEYNKSRGYRHGNKKY